MPQILATARLLLREIEEADLPALHRIYADERCMRYYPGTKTLPETADWFRRLAFESYAAHDFGLWAVVLKETGAVIGDCGITLQPTPSGLEPEIGYHLQYAHWGRGYATEAAIGCRDHSLSVLRAPRVVSIVAPENLPSRRVAARVHRRRETFTERRATGGTVERYLYITDNG